MAKRELYERAISMRKEGKSYSQIRDVLEVSKGSLSRWLKEYPLPHERINELRENSEKRIERCRETKARKRAARVGEIYTRISEDIGVLSDRELFLAGLFLYWAECTKGEPGRVCMTNTDPSMLFFFMRWLSAQGIEHSRLKVKLHLYSDMDIEAETAFWSKTLALGQEAFRKPYIKATVYDKPKNYRGRFGHGTCNVFLNDVLLYEKILAGIDYLGSVSGSVRKFEAV
ncbi:MAG: hypothetical protein V4644_03475 [Patescibacteria group bacterium]